MHDIKKVTFGILVLHLLLIFQSVSDAKQITRPVTYHAKFAPLGDGIEAEKYIPSGDDVPFSIYFGFMLSPGTLEAEIHTDVTFDQENQTLSVHPRTVTEDGNTFVGRFKSTGGLIITGGEIIVDMTIPIPLLSDIEIIDHRIPITDQEFIPDRLSNILNINKGWNEEKFFDSLLLKDGEFVQLEAGIPNIFSQEIGGQIKKKGKGEESFVEISVADVVLFAISSGTAVAVTDKIKKHVLRYFSDAAFQFNMGFMSRLKLSGAGIYLDDSLARHEGQTVAACSLKNPSLSPSLNSYALSTSYIEDLTIAVDLMLSLDAAIKFAPLGITLWDYTRELTGTSFPIKPEEKVDNLNFVATPDPITFPVSEAGDFAQDFLQQHLPRNAKAIIDNGLIEDITYSSDGCLFAVASSIGIWLYNVYTDEEPIFIRHNGATSVSFSPDGTILASGSDDDDSMIYLWEVSRNGKLKTMLTGHKNGTTSISFSPDGKTIASGGGDALVRLWDVDTLTEIGTLTGNRGTFIGHRYVNTSISFSPDGKTIASEGRLWDVETLTEIGASRNRYIRGNSMSFSPDGKTLATAGVDGTVWVWNAETWGIKATLTGEHTLTEHRYGTPSISFSPDGKTIASGSVDGTIWVWDVETLTKIDTLTGHKGSIKAVRFSPNGKTLATADETEVLLWDVYTRRVKATPRHTGSISYWGTMRRVVFSRDRKTFATTTGGMVRLWDTNTGAEKATLHHHGAWQVRFSPDGKTLATADETEVRLWDTNTGAEKATLPTTSFLGDIRFSPDGETIASSGSGVMRLWDVNTGTEKVVIPSSSLPYVLGQMLFRFSPDGETLITWSPNGFGGLRLWDVNTGTEKAILSHSGVSYRNIIFSPDSKTLASGGDGVRLWDVNTGTEKATLHHEGVTVIGFSADGKTLASGGGDVVRLWDVNTGTEKATLHHDNVWSGNVWGISFSPDGKTLASGGHDVVQLWDVDTGTEKAILNHSGVMWNITFSPDGKTLASEGNDVVRLWEVDRGTEKATLYHEGVTVIGFSSDGKTLATASSDGTVRLWDATAGGEKATFWHTEPVNNVSFSPDGKTLAGGSSDGTTRLWDADTGTLKATLPGHIASVNNVTFSPDSETLATASDDTTAILWDVDTGMIKTWLWHEAGVNSVTFSPDGKTLASGNSDKTVRLWDVNTGTLKIEITGHKYGITSVSFSPDGKTLASGSSDKTARLWDVNTGTLKIEITGHKYGITSVSFSPDGKTLATAGSDETVRLWDVNTGTLRMTLRHRSYDDVNSVSFSPDGKTIAAASQGGLVYLWDVNTRILKATFPGYNDVSFSPDSETIASTSSDGTVILWHLTPTGTTDEIPYLAADVNSDGMVNIQDLVVVATALGEAGENDADVNGDGSVNIRDIVAVAGALNDVPAAPTAIRQQVSAHLTLTNMQQWLIQAQHLHLKDPTAQRGVQFLQYLLAVLTPQEMALLQNYPNPFNPETWIPYQLTKSAEVTLTVYDINGSVVRSLYLGHQRAGMYHGQNRAAYWDGRNKVGEPVASGIYFYTITAGDFTDTRKMLIRK